MLSSVKYDNSFKKDEEYFIKNPIKVWTDKSGICYDIVELQKIFFPSNNYKTFFAFCKLPVTDNPTHTFFIVEYNKKFYWLENAWQSKKGIYGPFFNFRKAIVCVKNKLKKEWKKSSTIFEYKKFSYEGMNIPQFSTYIMENFYENN